ncbi:FAD/NAD(P)-binding domain-containing protein [Xylariomycetidae sp. FL0641]|nr:FAD/NAD(P)-binding domain-containing protein [Xylariomycetidae sp. FL0641]
MAKSVCIVGAGPSGLVAAKTLLHDAAPGAFSVTIFDGQHRIGGLWPTRRDDGAGLIHPLMVANQSRHTVQFSDFAWRDTDPEFPRAWQVGQYLERYVLEYAGGATVRLGHRVVGTELLDGGSWRVSTESEKGAETSVFDYLLVATGYFGKPLWPANIPKEGDVPIVHSSKYRDIKSLLSPNVTGSKILVAGGQMSGIEIAGTIATHLSSATHSPGEKVIPNPDRYSIHHVAQRPAWVFPLFTSPKADAAAPPFLPCDLPSYNLANRPKPLTNTQGHISVDAARRLNSIFESVLGGNQSEYSAETAIAGDLLEQPPYLAMSSHYANFVRSGLIQVHRGKLDSLSGSTASLAGPDAEVDDIAAVVLATGFDPSPSVAFLPAAVLATLAHSPAHPHLPLALAFHGTHHPSLPTLGFVGFYRSPYWGVMEMQARFLGALWSSPPPPSSSSSLAEALQADDSIARTLALRADPRCSQFPMGDYAFLMQEFAAALDIPISPPLSPPTPPAANGLPMDVLTPSRYLPPRATAAQRAHAEANRALTHATATAGLDEGKFVAGAVFRSLQGTWRLSRRLSSRLPSHPSGTFEGTAQFLLRRGTGDGRASAAASSTSGPACAVRGGSGTQGSGEEEEEWGDEEEEEYLYIEDGTFTAATGLRFRATRRYVWRYDGRADALSVWFARVDDGARADYLFHELAFQMAPADGDENKWRARASHLCIDDLYDVHYAFGFRAVGLRHWTLAYSVKGPKKDYTIEGSYSR